MENMSTEFEMHTHKKPRKTFYFFQFQVFLMTQQREMHRLFLDEKEKKNTKKI
jgi:hypothetical protein